MASTISCSDTSCPACAPRETKVVLDTTVGDLICTACGLVLEARCIDEGSEWRNFAPEGVTEGPRVNGRDRGADFANQVDELSGSMGLTTMHGTSEFAQELMRSQRFAESKVVHKDAAVRVLERSEAKVKKIVQSLLLPEIVVKRCMDLLEFLHEKAQLANKREVSWFIAVVYLACREEGITRTFRELAAAFAEENGKSEADLEKSLRRRVSELQRALSSKLKAISAYISPAELMNRFVSRLQLHHEVSTPAVTIAQRAKQFDVVRPKNEKEQCAIIASSIFMVSWLLDVDEKPRLADVSVIAKVPEGTVQDTYNKMRPHATMLLPETFKVRLVGGVASLPAVSR